MDKKCKNMTHLTELSTAAAVSFADKLKDLYSQMKPNYTKAFLYVFGNDLRVCCNT